MSNKYLDIGDITYILKEYADKIPEKIINDIYFELLDYVTVEESK